jgi:hypothetical protein
MLWIIPHLQIQQHDVRKPITSLQGENEGKYMASKTVIFTDPWNGKHDATVKDVNPENSHATLQIDASSLDLSNEDEHVQKWFKEKAGKFEDVPPHEEGVPYSYKEQ